MSLPPLPAEPSRQARPWSKWRPTATGALALLLVGAALGVGLASIPQTGPAAGGSSLPRVEPVAYPVPEGAVFVAPTGSDTAPGTAAQPLRTLARAVVVVPAAGTVVLRQGDYRESAGSIAKPLTLQSYPNERATLNGSVVVTGWVPQGSLWRKNNWTYDPPRGRCPPKSIDKATNALACYSDMVFVDGVPLVQVASLAEVGAGKFYADLAANTLDIGSDPEGRTVEASVHQRAFELNAGSDGSVIRGISVSQYGPAYQDPMVRIRANRVTFADNVVTRSAMFGLGVSGEGISVQNNTIEGNGLVGIGGYGPRNLLLEGNTLRANNAERFALGWEAAGAKLLAAKGMVVRDNVFENNLGKGFWCDGSCYDLTFVRNRLTDNDIGFFYEISHRALVASNLFTGNRSKSVSIGSSSSVSVWNNTFVSQGVGVHVYQDVRTQSPTPADVALGITWIVDAIAIRNNISWQAGSIPGITFIWTQDARRERSGSQLVEDLDFNAYYRSVPGRPSTVARWALAGATYSLLRTFPELQNVSGQENNGLAAEGGADPFFVDASGGDYRLSPGSLARGRGAPVPADVAAAVGVPAGFQDLGAIRWPT